MGRAKIIFSAVLIAILCFGAVDASAQYTTIRRGGNNNTEQQEEQRQQRRQTTPTKEQQYQKDLKAGETLFDKEQYADAKKHFVKMLPKYPKHKQEINDWIASCEMMLEDANYGVQTTQTQTSGSTTSAFADKTITVNGVSFKMIAVKGGTFTMGATSEQGSDVEDDETPTHRVTLSDYYIGETEVTQALWEAVMGSNPSNWKGSNLPVENVSWEDCQEFISRLNSLTGKNFSLPTEAEWEYASRGGNKSQGYKYSGSNVIDRVAWYKGNSGWKTHPVKQKLSNELGIYDMTGNVWEWCMDWYGSYSSGSQTNPSGPSTGSSRVLHGGNWGSDARDSRVSNRNYNNPDRRYSHNGLRLCSSSL